MRRTLLLALAGVATLATGCMAGNGAAQSSPVVPQAAMVKPAAHPAVAKPPAATQAALRAKLAAATHATLATGSAVWSESLLLPGAPSVAHVSADEPAAVVGDLDFTHNRGHLTFFADPMTVHLPVAALMFTGGKVYQVGGDGNGQPATATTETNPSNIDYLVQVLRWEQGPIKFSGWHHISGESGLFRVYSYGVNLTALNGGVAPSPAQSGVLSTLPTTQSAWLDAQGRIVALVDSVDLAGHSVPGVPAGVAQALVVQRFTSFGVRVYQHLDVPINATSPNPAGVTTS